MPIFFIRAVDAEFASSDEGAEYERPELALAVGIRSATAIVADEIGQGKNCAAVDVRIESEDGTPVLRSIVALSVLPLLSGLPAEG